MDNRQPAGESITTWCALTYAGMSLPDLTGFPAFLEPKITSWEMGSGSNWFSPLPPHGVIRLMKNDRLHATCQHAGTASNLNELCAVRTLTRSVSVSASSSASSLESVSESIVTTAMGLQPLSHAMTRLPQLVSSCTPSGVDQNCSCVVKPQERTILHGILTGQGHKFGYGESYISSVYVDSATLDDNSHNGLYPELQSLDDHQK
ncbi:hypothetical protein LSH36_162g07013 [Paralvinella palmiformis]|uniref:Uncharacterized protein n=1 Tax=Paralvinella palmiformis TaxID=53620 RepID=A0AAD9JTK2_9ANNE|nr:hypothetical protein LSH36_162g07013 [Paralvinella palmiformis]